jgi:hypothetical protein
MMDLELSQEAVPRQAGRGQDGRSRGQVGPGAQRRAVRGRPCTGASGRRLHSVELLGPDLVHCTGSRRRN